MKGGKSECLRYPHRTARQSKIEGCLIFFCHFGCCSLNSQSRSRLQIFQKCMIRVHSKLYLTCTQSYWICLERLLRDTRCNKEYLRIGRDQGTPFGKLCSIRWHVCSWCNTVFTWTEHNSLTSVMENVYWKCYMGLAFDGSHTNHWSGEMLERIDNRETDSVIMFAAVHMNRTIDLKRDVLRKRCIGRATKCNYVEELVACIKQSARGLR